MGNTIIEEPDTEVLSVQNTVESFSIINEEDTYVYYTRIGGAVVWPETTMRIINQLGLYYG